jgi:anti-sigma B factor antagonist
MQSPSGAAAGPDPADLLWVAAHPPDRRGRVVVEVVGEVDDYTAPLLASCLQGQDRRRGLRALVVDLTGVRFLSCAGLTVLEAAAERCAARGTRLLLRCGDRRAVLRALELARPALPVQVVDAPAGRPAAVREHRPAGRARERTEDARARARSGPAGHPAGPRRELPGGGGQEPPLRRSPTGSAPRSARPRR